MNLQIELRPHVGKAMVPGLNMETDIEFDQYMIFITGEDYKKATGNAELHAGFVHKQSTYTCPNTGLTFKPPINWLKDVNQWPQSVIDQLSLAVQNKLASLDNSDQGDRELVAAGDTRPVNVQPELPEMSEEQVAAIQAASDDDENL